MITKKIFLYVFITIIFNISCSNDESPDDENLNSVDFLVGEWVFESEHNYDCETDEILITRFADSDILIDVVFNEDGTYIEREAPDDPSGSTTIGTWERISETRYRFTETRFSEEEEEEEQEITFESEIGVDIIFEDNAFLHDIFGCKDGEPSVYDAVRWVRKN